MPFPFGFRGSGGWLRQASRGLLLLRYNRGRGFLRSVTEDTLGLCDFDHEQRVELHHLLAFGHHYERTSVEELAAVALVKLV